MKAQRRVPSRATYRYVVNFMEQRLKIISQGGCTYIDNWSDDLILWEAQKIDPQIHINHIRAWRQKEFGSLVTPEVAATLSLEQRLAALETRVQTLELGLGIEQ